MIIGCDNMSYEEAKEFYGEEICNLLIKIYNFCKQSGYVIYQHATDLDSANNIMRKGFICSTSKIASIPREILENEPSDYTYDDDGIKTSIYDGGQCQFRQSGIRDELSDTQHFFENTHCNLDFGSLTNPDINRSGFGATCIFVVSKDFHGSREYKQFGIVESHFDDWEDQQVRETYFERHIIPKQFCIGYLDVNNKRFVANPSFQFNYGINDELSLGTTTATERDLSIELENSIRRSR
jgi:hypothetical protein